MTTTEERAAPPAGRLRRTLDVIDDRLGVKALQYPVPEHANTLGWSLGGLTLVTLVVLIATGIVLAQFYNPAPEAASASVRNIVTGVWAGQFLRGVHYWAAQAMYVLTVLHLLRVFLTGSYKRPREANWLIGLSMFALIIGAIFTGTVIKWDQEGFEALTHNIEIGRFLGGAGFWFTDTFSTRVPMLVRLYVAHVVVIPGLILGLFALHAMLIKRHAISPKPTAEDPAPATSGPEEAGPFTHHLRRIGAFALILLAVLGALAILLPPGIGPPPVEGIEVTRPVWMFWWYLPLESRWGAQAILFAAGSVFVLLGALPFIDRNPNRWWRRRPVAMAALVIVLGAVIALTILTALTPPAAHL